MADPGAAPGWVVPVAAAAAGTVVAVAGALAGAETAGAVPVPDEVAVEQTAAAAAARVGRVGVEAEAEDGVAEAPRRHHLDIVVDSLPEARFDVVDLR